MVHCCEHVIQSTESVRGLVGESSATSFQLNERQCRILAGELVETCTFLEERNVRSKFVEGVGCISLQHLFSAVNRAEVLIKKCCCRDLKSWLVAAMMLVEIQEEFMAIILDIHLWRMFLDFAITCGRDLSREEKSESMKIMDEEHHEMSKNLRRESYGLRRAATEDKKTIILKTSSIVGLCGSISGLDHLRAIFLQSWLTDSDACRDVDLKEHVIVNYLGRGASGTILKVKWLGIECALKVLDWQDGKEATAFKGLFHPNIIRLFHYWEDDPQSRLLMELMPKDLGAYMRERMKTTASSKLQMGKDSGPFSLPVAIDIMHQIAQAMRYMHEKRLTHRDLKPANVLVKERPKVGLPCIDGAGYLDIKLADFGFAKSFKNTSTSQAHSGNQGTGLYRAPEVFGKDMALKRNYLPLADVWSFGITCAEILSGKEVYADCVEEYGLAIPSMVCKEGLRPTLLKDCPPYLAFCIKSCWEFLPTRRPNFSSICKLLRHAKLLSLGVTKLNDSKSFFAYTTRSEQPILGMFCRVSKFFQSPLKFMGIGHRLVPNVAEVLPATAILPKVRPVPPPLIPEDGVELNEETCGGMGSAGGFSDGERHSSPIFPVNDILHEDLVVSTGMVSEDSSLSNEHIAGSITIVDNPTQVLKSLVDLEEPVQQTHAILDNAIVPSVASDPIESAIMLRKKLGTEMLTTEADGGKLAKIYEIEKEDAVAPLVNRQKKHSEQNSKKPGGLFFNVPVQQTNRFPIFTSAISFREDSYPIQAAIMPRKKLGTVLLTTEADGGKLEKICESEEDDAATPLGNRQDKHFGQNIREPSGLLSNIQALVSFEVESAESELPKYHKAASPTTLRYGTRVGRTLTLPKPILPPEVEVLPRYTASSSTSDGERNNDTGPSPSKLLLAMLEVKSAVNHFARVLIAYMNKHPVELELLKQTILREVRTDTDRANPWEFVVQAFLCQRLFDGFDTPNGYFGIEYFQGDQMTKLNSYADFSKYKDKAATISMLLDSNPPDQSFLGKFCFKKFKSIVGESASNLPLAIYRDEWDAVKDGYHPNTVFYYCFLKVDVSVWLVHRLAHSFDEKVDMLIYEKGAKYQRQTMDSVVPSIYSQADEVADANTEIAFSVLPGFQVGVGSVAKKCEVCLPISAAWL